MPRCDVFELGFAQEKAVQGPLAKDFTVFDVPWAPNTSSRVCYVCQTTFGMFRRRRHHCRLCGKLVCNPCSQSRSFVRKRNANVKLERTCLTCSTTLRQLIDLGDSRVKLTARKAAKDDVEFHAHASVLSTQRPPHRNAKANAYGNGSVNANGRGQSVKYVVAAAWYRRYQANEKSLGQISNHTLLHFYEGRLHRRPSLQSTDCVLVEEDKWQSLWRTYGGGPCITTPSAISKWTIEFPTCVPTMKKDPEENTTSSQSCRETMPSFNDNNNSTTNNTVTNVTSLHEAIALTKARQAAAAFAAAASLARQESETIAMRKSMACLADFEDIRLSRHSISNRYSIY